MSNATHWSNAIGANTTVEDLSSDEQQEAALYVVRAVRFASSKYKRTLIRACDVMEKSEQDIVDDWCADGAPLDEHGLMRWVEEYVGVKRVSNFD